MKTKTLVNRKEEIINQAEKLFRDKGYPASVMRELALSVGIEPSSMYSHFKSKEDILWEIALKCANDFRETAEPIANSQLSADEKLRRMLVAHVEVVLRNQNAAVVFMTEWRHLTEPRLTDYAQMRDNYEQLFRNVIRQGVEEKVFRPIEPKFASLTLLSALNWTYQWFKPGGERTPTEVGEQLAEILLNGLKAN